MLKQVQHDGLCSTAVPLPIVVTLNLFQGLNSGPLAKT